MSTTLPAATKARPAVRAIRAKGWLAAHRWLLTRRAVQLGALGLFLSGPLVGLWVLKGTLASSTLFGVVPFTDPLFAAQALAAGHVLGGSALIGAALLIAFYAVVGGRAFCAWICPVNLLTDAAHWLRRRLGLRGNLPLARTARFWVLAAVLAAALVTGVVTWEAVNPVTLLHRGLVFGTLFTGGMAWTLLLALGLFDLFFAERGWCGHLCPVGAAYGLIGTKSLIRVSARRREACDDCLACIYACPEPHVIPPALRGRGTASPVITSPDCTNCGRCLDVCPERVFAFTHRFDDATETASTAPGHDAGARAA